MAKKTYWIFYILFLNTTIQIVNGGFQKLFLKGIRYERLSLLNFTEISTEYGYKSEEHTVITEDGYVLTLFRIPRGKNCHFTVRRTPVLIMHGLLLSSDSWIDSGPEAGLAYLISDDCYDLWAGNVRGNYYSRNHTRMNPDVDPEFWKFSLNEVGVYDLPAIIDYILEYTRSEKLNYIGYSQSGGSFVIMCSERPGYCGKVSVAILFHPAAKMTNVKSQAFRIITEAFQILEPNNQNALEYEALPRGGYIQKMMHDICQNDFIADTICRSILTILDSYNPGSISVSTIRALTGHFPAGTSFRVMAWFSQVLNKEEFQNFDYGPVMNMKIYGRKQPTTYNCNATTAPVVIIHGENDNIVSKKDVEWLKGQLPNVLEVVYVKNPLWNHFDVPYSQHTREMLYPKIGEYLFKYSGHGAE
ncbi:unnamed protein product [Parnassius mnemosyne]|uniref:Lipase n=1 Tax=Parnassius mnemosyne TaxID=213953 RepID=A0AAV1L8R7_9NEOP